MKQKIILSIGARDEAFDSMYEALKQVADVQITGLYDYNLKDADIFIGKKMDEAKLSEANRLKAVFAYKTGVDDFPLDKLSEKRITVCNSHANSDCIAEYAFGLAMALVHRTVEFDAAMRDGDWKMSDPFWQSLFEMKIGLVGYGSIGKAIAKILKANGISTYTIDRGKNYDGINTASSLEELCDICDLLILSLPRTPDTDGMFDKSIFSRLKGKYIVNVGRSNCINEADLYDALSTKQLRGAAIDTWQIKPVGNEPLKPFAQPFDTLDNIILASHKATFVASGHRRYVEDTLQNVLQYLNGKPPRNVINPKLGY